MGHVGGGGRRQGLHLSYLDDTNDGLKYATCATSCATTANWTSGAVGAAGSGLYNSLAVDADGRIHVSYYDVSARAPQYIG